MPGKLKDYFLEMGELGGEPMSTDELLKDKISERRRKEIERQDELDEKKHAAAMAELEKKTKSATAESEKVERRADYPESPIKMSGSIDLGHISLTEQMNESKEESKAAQATLGQRLDDAEKATREATERAHNAEMAMVQKEMTTRLDGLEKAIVAGFSQKNITAQIAEVQELAGELGYNRPDPNLPGAGDANIKLQMLQMQLDEKARDREFKWKIRQDEKNWQLEMQKLTDDRDFKRGEAVRQQKRDDMFASAPQMLGGAIAKGLMDRGTEETIQKSGQKHRIDAAPGATGQVECSECSAPVTVGPTARKAVCADCGAEFTVRRVPQESAE